MAYGSCMTCRHTKVNEWEEPCSKCKNNFIRGTEEYEVASLLWESDEPSEPSSAVAHPSHYNQGNIECIDAMVAAYGKEAVRMFCLLNAFKYLWREEHKNGNEDLEKAIWYLKKRLELSDDE